MFAYGRNGSPKYYELNVCVFVPEVISQYSDDI